MHPPISDYALLGDCETAALVDKTGSIDWLCWPRFDSEACFARLLGTADHGFWRISPSEPARVTRTYRPGTLVLESRFETSTGIITLIDFMPMRERDTRKSDVIRIVRCEQGEVALRMELVIRFNYGSIVPWASRTEDGDTRVVAGPHSIVLRTPVPTHGENLRTVAELTVRKGESVPFAITYEASHMPVPPRVDPERALAATCDFWKEWSSRTRYEGPWNDAVERSLITLKALTYRPTGGVLAAPTTSLPETVGGVRNWDYRFCWLRDTTFTLLSLLNAGYRDEAEAWCDWLLRAIAGAASQIQPVYGLSGEPRIVESELDWLPGYSGSKPVRIGNAAYSQLQLDIFGNVMDTLHESRKAGLNLHEASEGLQSHLVSHLESLWNQPDEGIWEIRADKQHFVHSKVMCWVAFDRAVKGCERYGLQGPVERWRKLRDQLHAQIIERGFNAKLEAFTQAYDRPALDAATLLIPIVGFLPPNDKRVVSTVNAVEKNLMRDGLVLRYDTGTGVDGLPSEEGAFIACTYWLADNMVLQGRQEDAQRLFERVLGLRNDVGLL